jgi:hypothetical protein
LIAVAACSQIRCRHVFPGRSLATRSVGISCSAAAVLISALAFSPTFYLLPLVQLLLLLLRHLQQAQLCRVLAETPIRRR